MGDYVGFIFQGFFMGIGTASGLWFYEWWVKPRLEKARFHTDRLVRK